MKRIVASSLLALSVSAGVGLLSKMIAAPSWSRTSYRGSSVSLRGGVSVVAGLVAGSSVTPDSQLRFALFTTTAAGTFAGYIDDHLEDKFHAKGKGFRGHLGALRHGRFTSGVAKIAIIGLGSVVSGIALEKPRDVVGYFAVGVDAALIAGTANIINLLDLRPGRALKATLGVSVPVLCLSPDARIAGGALIGSCCAALPSDLSGETMLGDLGANAIGAHLGVLVAHRASLPVKLAALGVVSALTLASERFSFSEVIENTPLLKFIDELGRR